MTHLIESVVMEPKIIGKSKQINTVLETCKKIVGDLDPIILHGEIGTGKKILAAYIHHLGQRSNKPFFIVDCSDPMGLISEMFKEEFSLLKELRFLEGGSIYFEEICGLNIKQQAKLSQFCSIAKKLNIQVILSTTQNIHHLIYDKAFDVGLYRILSQREVHVPALRERKEDLLEFIDYFIKILNKQLNKSIQGLTPQVEEIFFNYDWPTNIKELKYILTKAILSANEPLIGKRHLKDSFGITSDETSSLFSEVIPLERMEEILLSIALNRYGQSLEGKKRAAKALNISLATLYNKVRRYKLNE